VKLIAFIGLIIFLFLPLNHIQSVNAQKNQIGNSDPWDDAVSEALQLLDENPNFIKHLREYEAKGEDVDQYLAQVERARPALDLIDDLKRTDLIIGSAWDLIVEALDSSYPGSSEAILYIDEGLREVLRFRGELSKLSALSPVSTAVNQFRSNPSKQTLVSWNDTCGTAIDALNDVDDEIKTQSATVSDLHDSVGLTQQALNGIGGLIGIGGEINDLNRAISKIVQPLADLDAALDVLHSHAQEDIAVMREVQNIVERAKNPPLVSKPSDSSRTSRSSSASTSPPSVGVIFLGVAVVIGAVVLVTSLSKRSRSQIGERYPHEEGSVVIKEAQAALRIQSSTQQGKVYPLRDGYVIGRGSNCDIQIVDRSISRIHALIRNAEGSWYIQDQGSSSGTYVNQNLVSATRLFNGDVIKLGDTDLVFTEDTP